PFSSSLICSAIALMYGVQYHVSNSAGVMVLGSLRAKASSGLVSALTYSRRYCPGLLASCCAMASDATMASSSGPPVVKIPTTVSAIPVDLSVADTIRTLPGFTSYLLANPAPTTHSVELSLNHFPSTCHQGFVFSIPVS